MLMIKDILNRDLFITVKQVEESIPMLLRITIMHI